MADTRDSLLARLNRWFADLPKYVWLLGVAAVLAAAAGGGVFLYRTYNYVQHDNDFCLSCHLMQDPYQRFARSAHRGLGCKACHQPTLITRSRMALTQIIEQPQSLTAHAEVPNRVCANCHIEGDPAKWELIRNSAGHRIHLDSKDPALKGLQCVRCHATSLHEFAAVDQTCGQAGCHQNTRIRLGKMGQLTIHCAACHPYNAPVPANASTDSLAAALRPERQQCLSCHAMRVLLADFPANDPHQGSCGSCHNPHTQTTPAQAVQSCTNAGCHSRPDALTPFHRGLEPGVVDNCINCHKAHSFRVNGQDCLSCHQNIYSPRGPGHLPARPTALLAPPVEAPTRGTPSVRSGGSGAQRDPVAPVGSRVSGRGPLRFASLLLHPAGHVAKPPRSDQASTGQGLPQDTMGFQHSLHRGVACTACHNSSERHGAVTVTSLRDCQSCHHTAPVVQRCTSCHRPNAYGKPIYRERRTVKFSVVRSPVTRTLPFNHSAHQDVACVRCHTEPLTMSAAAVDCSSCHDAHHRPDTDCMACHRPVPAGTHPLSAHVNCSGSGCHQPAPFTQIPRTRSFCLACHQDRVQHRPGRNCADCHVMPGSQSALLEAAGRSGE